MTDISTSPICCVPGGLRLPPHGARGRLAAQAEPRGALADLSSGGAGAHAGGTGEAPGGDLEAPGVYIHRYIDTCIHT